MPQPRPTVPLNVRIDPKLAKQLKHVCIERGVTMAAFVEKAVAARLGQILNANAGRAGKMRKRLDVYADVREEKMRRARKVVDELFTRRRRRGSRATLEAMFQLPSREAPRIDWAPRKPSKRHCSFCRQSGHYAPKCPEREARAHGDGA